MKKFVLGILAGSLMGMAVAKGTKSCKNMIKKVVDKM